MTFTADDYRTAAANTRNNPKMQAMLSQAAIQAEFVEDVRGLATSGLQVCRHDVDLEHHCNACTDEDAAGGRPNPRREYDRRQETGK